MTLVELLAKSNVAYVTIEPTFPGPIVCFMAFDNPKRNVKFTVWRKGKHPTRKYFETEVEAVAYMQRLINYDIN